MSPERVDGLREIAFDTLTVSLRMSPDVHQIPADLPASTAAADLAARDFDTATVAGGSALMFVLRDALEGSSGSVGDHARPLTSNELISADTGMTRAIQRLGKEPVLFVLGRGGVSGVVTRSDMQRPAAAMLVLTLLLATEMDLRRLIAARAGDRWHEALTLKRYREIQLLFEARRAANAELSELDCLTLTDRLDVVRNLPELRDLLDFSSKREVQRLKKELQDVRNCLAHAGDLLSAADGDPAKATKIVDMVSSFGEQVRRAINPG